MAALTTQFLHCRSVGCQSIGHDLIRQETLSLQQFYKDFQGLSLVSALLDKGNKDNCFVIHGTPHVHMPATDFHHHFVKIARGARSSIQATEIARNLRTELSGPASYGFIADFDSALSEQIFDVS